MMKIWLHLFLCFVWPNYSLSAELPTLECIESSFTNNIGLIDISNGELGDVEFKSKLGARIGKDIAVAMGFKKIKVLQNSELSKVNLSEDKSLEILRRNGKKIGVQIWSTLSPIDEGRGFEMKLIVSYKILDLRSGRFLGGGKTYGTYLGSHPLGISKSCISSYQRFYKSTSPAQMIRKNEPQCISKYLEQSSNTFSFFGNHDEIVSKETRNPAVALGREIKTVLQAYCNLSDKLPTDLVAPGKISPSRK